MQAKSAFAEETTCFITLRKELKFVLFRISNSIFDQNE